MTQITATLTDGMVVTLSNGRHKWSADDCEDCDIPEKGFIERITSNVHIEGDFDEAQQKRLAHSVTWHCLIGCGIGEVVGVVIGTALGLPSIQTLVLALALGFVVGFVFGLWPLMRAGYIAAFPVNYILVGKGIRHVH